MLTGVTDERGIRSVNYEYNSIGRLNASYVGAQTPVISDCINGISIFYNSNGTRTITSSRGNNSTYTTIYQLDKFLTTEIIGAGCTSCGKSNVTYSYDPADNKLLLKTKDNLTTTYSNYNTNGNPGTITEAFGTPKARQTDYTYDPRFFKKILSKTEPSVYATGYKITTYTYDNFGNTTRIIIDGFSPDGTAKTRTTSLQYNGPLNLLTQIDGPRTDINDITTLDYYPNDPTQTNNRARLKTITTSGITLRDNIQYTPTGKAQTETRPNGLQITNTYYPGNDRLQTATETANGINRITQFTYLATGEVNSVTTAVGTTDATTITDGLGNYIKYTLDF